jgi:hypothetical protein
MKFEAGFPLFIRSNPHHHLHLSFLGVSTGVRSLRTAGNREKVAAKMG